MKHFLECELFYFNSPHLYQVYDGFAKLHREGIIKLKTKRVSGNENKPLLTVIINKKYKAIYDTLDGMNWVDGSIEKNIDHFKKNFEADFYFKRSYDEKFKKYAPDNCKVYPLGLNYKFQPDGNYLLSARNTFAKALNTLPFLASYFGKKTFQSNDFEHPPFPERESKVLFLARLWDPGGVTLDHLQSERETINRNRINCIKACKKEFGNLFLGGLQRDSFSIANAKNLIMPFGITKRDAFLNAIKHHNICIATTGLHNSIGGKFAEYVAASRAILSEPIHYAVPGNFTDGKNYYTFLNEDELINHIHFLFKNNDVLTEMMAQNYHYYNNFVRPDKLVLNTLIEVYKNI